MVSVLCFGLLFQPVLSSQLVSYQFGKNFGQVFYDFSSSGNHGQNGESVDSTLYDTIPIDRGAYFSSSSSFIQLPPNNINSNGISLGSLFSIVLWVYPFDAPYDLHLTFRIKDCSNYFSLFRLATFNTFRCEINKSGLKEIHSSQKFQIAVPSNSYLEKWVCASMINDDITTLYAANGIQVLQITQTTTYSETGSYNHYIGSPGSSFIGFLWSFYIFNESVILSNFYDDIYNGANCLVPPCSPPCSPGIKEESLSYCISTLDTTSCPSCSFGCSEGVCLDCSPCNSKSCKLINQQVLCICPFGSTGFNCSCASDQYFNSSIFNCKKCHDECSSCKEDNICLECPKTNSEPHVSRGCQCKVGYFNVSALIDQGTCSICSSDCLSCSNDSSCTSCKAENSELDSFGKCACKNGFIQDKEMSFIDACICQGNNRILENGDCKCKVGYFIKDDSKVPAVCSTCPQTCFECENSVHCDSCNFTTSFFDSEGICRCVEGFYNNNSKSCVNCTKDCFGCNSKSNCTLCNYQNSFLENNTCICKKGYWKNPSSEEETCLPCTDIESGLILNETCMCDDGFFLQNDLTCVKCEKDCFECQASSYCSICDYENSHFEDRVCKCKDGFILDQTCKPNVFYANLTISMDFKATIWFDQKLKDPLDESQLLIFLDEKSINFQIKTIEMDRFEVEYDQDLLTKTSVFRVSFSHGIISERSAMLQTKFLNKTISVDDEMTKLQELKKEAKKSLEMAEDGSTAGVSLSLGISLLSFDANSFFDFLSTAEIFYSPYLFNLQLNPILESFLLGTRVQKKTVKVIKKLIDERNGIALNKKYELFGFSTNLFLINTEPFMQTFIGLCALFILLSLLKMIQMLERKLNPICSLFRYTIFLRFWMQSFLEFLICLNLGFSKNSLNNAFQIINLSILTIISVLIKQAIEILMVFYLIKLVYDRSLLKTNQEIQDFNKKFGIFFIEFKDEHFRYWLFYVFFIWRRILIAGFLLIEIDGVAQIIFSASFSSIIFLYVLFFRCFKSKLLNAYHIVKEALILIYYAAIFYSCLNGQKMTRNISYCCICLIAISWGLNSAFNILTLIMKIIERIKRWRQRSSIAQVHNLNSDETNIFSSPNLKLK